MADDVVYKQSGAIPLKRESDGFHVLLVTTRGGKRWIIPKGFIEPNMTPAESAANECFEEAGIEGHIADEMLSTYLYSRPNGAYEVSVFVMYVHTVHEAWPEQSFRQRQWFDVETAITLIEEPDLKTMIAKAADML